MANCGHACPYNTLDGCKVKEYNAICPLTNMATPVTEYRMTNADRIRAMTDEELSEFMAKFYYCDGITRFCQRKPECDGGVITDEMCQRCLMDWLEQPAEE